MESGNDEQDQGRAEDIAQSGSEDVSFETNASEKPVQEAENVEQSDDDAEEAHDDPELIDDDPQEDESVDQDTADVNELVEDEQEVKKKRTMIIAGIVAGAVLLVAIIVVIAVLVLQQKALDEELTALANQGYAVEVELTAEKWDPENSTPIPMKVSGTDYSGASFENAFLYDGSGQLPIELKRGSYTVKVESSPINADGGIYDVSNASAEVTIVDAEVEQRFLEEDRSDLSFDAGDEGVSDEATEDEPGEGSEGKPGDAEEGQSEPVSRVCAVKLVPIEEAKVTDDQIIETYDGLVESGYDEENAKEFRKKAIEARDEAVKKAKEAELEASREFTCDVFSLKVPASWAGTDWRVEKADLDFVVRQYEWIDNPTMVAYYFYYAGSHVLAFEAGFTNADDAGMRDWVTRKKGYTVFLSNDDLSAREFEEVIKSLK